MRGGTAAAALVLLASCAREGGQEPGPAPTATATASALTGAVSGQGGSADEVPAVGGRLTAQVSALNADVSGLNTRMSDMGLVIDLPADALFEFDKADLTPVAQGELSKAAELIRRSPAGVIRVIGHTDAKGDDRYNQRLSEDRARAVADWFGGQVGVRTRQFEVSGKGETAPIAPNIRADGGDDAAGRTKNRRVEVIIPKP